MKTLTQVVLPILLVVGLVFGITFINNYSNNRPEDSKSKQVDTKGSKTREAPLKFFTLVARRDSTGPRHLHDWNADCEIGSSGKYEYWFQNRHEKPVTVSVPRTNCQCAAAEMGIVPPEAWRNYLQTTALSGFQTGPLALIAAAYGTSQLSNSVKWEVMKKDETHPERIVPAATKDQPQMGMIRLGWTPKPPVGDRSISADLIATLEGGEPAQSTLEARINVVSAFGIITTQGGEWGKTGELRFGNLGPATSSTSDIVVFSSTRSQLVLEPVLQTSSGTDVVEPSVTWTKPETLDPKEFDALNLFLAGGGTHAKCAYRIKVTVNERLEIEKDGKKLTHQMDLGPIDLRMKVVALQGGEYYVPLIGNVEGDVRLLQGADNKGRIDFGNSFPTDRPIVKDVILVGQRPGLELELLEKETIPGYLQAKLESTGMVEGRNQWRLRLTIPSGRLYGSLPSDAVVVLKTKDTPPRRVRLPLKGASIDSGGPRF